MQLVGSPVATDPNIETIATAKKVMAFGDMSKYFISEVSGFTLDQVRFIMRLQMILSLSERFIELMETLWTQMQLKEWLWANPNHFYIWQQIKSLLQQWSID